MRNETRKEHEIRVDEAIAYIVDHLSDPIELGALADRACKSRFHFHRVFEGLLGETAADLVRRLRLELAAHRLRATRCPVTELAFVSGYATHEAFIRAFRSVFGCTPSLMRRTVKYEGLLLTPNGLHFNCPHRYRLIPLPGDANMQIEIRDLDDRKAVCLAHSGPYYMIGQTFCSARQKRT